MIGLKKSNQTLIRLSDYIKKYDRFSRYRIKSMKGGFHLHLLVFPFVYHFRTIMIAQVESTFGNLTELFIFITLQNNFNVDTYFGLNNERLLSLLYKYIKWYKGTYINDVRRFSMIFDPPSPLTSDFYLLMSDFFRSF